MIALYCGYIYFLGNKFGACDGDGNVAFWQASNATAPFFVRLLQYF